MRVGARLRRPGAAPAGAAAAVARAGAGRAADRAPRRRWRSRAGPRSACSAVLGVLLALLALRRVGAENVVTTLVHSSPAWVLIALGLFSASMVLRAVSWYHIVRAALPDRPVKRRTIMSGTAIGVLMSATLPARLGEPSRALVVSRRIGRMRETLPVVAGTLVSQTLLNLLALAAAGGAGRSARTTLFRGHEGALSWSAWFPSACSPRSCSCRRCCTVAASSRARARLGRLAREAVAALLRLRRGLVVFRQPRGALLGDVSAARGLGAAAVRRLRAAAGARASTAAPGSAPPPRCCSRST